MKTHLRPIFKSSMELKSMCNAFGRAHTHTHTHTDLPVTVHAFLFNVITVGVGTRDFGCWQLLNEMFYYSILFPEHPDNSVNVASAMQL